MHIIDILVKYFVSNYTNCIIQYYIMIVINKLKKPKNWTLVHVHK